MNLRSIVTTVAAATIASGSYTAPAFADEDPCAMVCTEVNVCDDRGDLLPEFASSQKEFENPTDYCWKERRLNCNKVKVGYLEGLVEKSDKANSRYLKIIKRLRRNSSR